MKYRRVPKDCTFNSNFRNVSEQNAWFTENPSNCSQLAASAGTTRRDRRLKLINDWMRKESHWKQSTIGEQEGKKERVHTIGGSAKICCPPPQENRRSTQTALCGHQEKVCGKQLRTGKVGAPLASKSTSILVVNGGAELPYAISGEEAKNRASDSCRRAMCTVALLLWNSWKFWWVAFN